MIDPDLIDEDGENRAVRYFLMLYGSGRSITATEMKKHMEACGFPYSPDWVVEAPGFLTKGGAQLWLRMLFALEQAPSVVEPVKATCRGDRPGPCAYCANGPCPLPV